MVKGLTTRRKTARPGRVSMVATSMPGASAK